MNRKEQKELKRKVQAVYLEKTDDQKMQTKSTDHNELSDNDLEQISGGLRASASFPTSAFENLNPIKNCWTNTI